MPEAIPPAVSPETPPAPPPAVEPPANPPSPPAATWRDSIADDVKDHAKNFTDINHVLRGHLDLRKKLSSAVVVPGKDAKPEQVAEFRTRLGVPESPDAYKFHTPEGYKPTDADLAGQKEWAKDFHDLNIPADAAFKLTEKFNARMAAAQAAQIAADKEFALASEAALMRVWKGEEFEVNKAFAKTAQEKAFGRNIDAARKLQTSDGRFVLDHPIIIEALAAIGREMGEPGLRGTVSPEQRAPLQEQYGELTKKIHDARARNDHIAVRQLDAKRMELAEKLFPGTNAPPGAQAA